jgi:hypothetical protein
MVQGDFPMRITSQILYLSLGVLLLYACTSKKEEALTDTLSGNKEEVLANTFFFGCAYLDSNGNSELDDADAMIAEMTFTITLTGGGGFSGRTSEKNCAMVIVPGGLDESYWPVKARMLPPESGRYELISVEEILLEYHEAHADFLYSVR